MVLQGKVMGIGLRWKVLWALWGAEQEGSMTSGWS